MAKRIVVIGIGYVGLPLAIILARSGYEVIGVDVKKDVVHSINNGIFPICELDNANSYLDENVKRNLSAREKPCEADVFIIAVPTPLNKRGRVADLSYVVSAIESFLPLLRKGNLIIIESTIPPLTCREIIKPLLEQKGKFRLGIDLFLAHCPERILPGNTFHELVFNNRIIGSIDSESSRLAKEIYSRFVKGSIDLVDDVTAETIKLVENTYRDVNIALANEFSLIGETLGIDIKKSIELANKHPRVNILTPGIGVGGHCLPKDPWLLIQADPKHTNIISTARRVNEMMPEKVASKIRKALSKVINPKIVALGMTYKPDSDDRRESPALEIIQILKEEGYDIEGYDNLIPDRKYGSIRKIAKGADCLAILVEHTEIKEELVKHSEEIKSIMKTPLILRIGTSYKPDSYDLEQRGKSA